MNDVKTEVTMTTDQEYFLTIKHRIVGIKAQADDPKCAVTEESGQHEIARLTVAMVDVRSRLTDDEVAACEKHMKDWTVACSKNHLITEKTI